MKKKAVNKTVKQILTIVPILFILLFLLTLICGRSEPFQPAAAPRKCKCISLKEAAKDLPLILFVCLGGSLISFPIGYEYNLNNLRKQAKRKEESEKNEEIPEDSGS